METDCAAAGLDHPTVVPSNFDPDEDEEADEENGGGVPFLAATEERLV